MTADASSNLHDMVTLIATVGVTGTASWALYLVSKGALKSARFNSKEGSFEFTGNDRLIEVAALERLQESLGAAVYTSYADEIKKAISVPTSADYSVIDLSPKPPKNGWLDTRLFLSAILMERMRALRSMVFVDSSETGERRFLGMASPGHVRWSIARRSPFIEEAFAHVYGRGDEKALSPQAPVELHTSHYQVTSMTGALSPQEAGDFIKPFLERLQRPAPQGTGWIPLPLGGVWEHASWIRANDLEPLLGSHLSTSQIVSEKGDLSERDATSVLQSRGDFVAVLDEKGIFNRLIDRRAWVEATARHVAQAR